MIGARVEVAALALVAALAFACEGIPGASGAQPTAPWSQALATQLASQLASGMTGLYDTAIKEPAFAGERAGARSTLENLRVLAEESRALKAQLEAGKTYEETVHTYENIKEVARDTQESESWTFLPADFTAKAEPAFAILKQLDAYYGAR
jgi:hypothetical protein